MYRRQTNFWLSKSMPWDRPAWTWYRHADRGYTGKPLNWLGFEYRSSVSSKWITPPKTWHFLTINKLHLLVLLALLPALWLYRQLHVHRRRRRVARGLCIACGYDLRASPSQCPECGQQNSRHHTRPLPV